MKIIFTSNSCWTMSNFRLGLLKKLIEEKYEIIVVAPFDETTEKLVSIGCTLYNIPLSPKGTNPISEVKVFKRLFDIYVREKADLIFHYTIKPNIYGTLAAKLARVPSIAVITGFGYVFMNNSIKSWIAKRLYSFSLKYSHKVWFLNQDDKDDFLKNCPDIKTKSYVLDGEGIDLDRYGLSSEVKNDNRITFLLIARMLWDKGIKEFVDAANTLSKYYSNVSFELLGPISDKNPSAIPLNEIQTWTSQNSSLIYLGETTDVRPYIKSASCIVLPSYREGVPRSLMEAAAMGKPLIATNVPGCREVINQKNGFLVEPKSCEDLRDKLEQFCQLDQKSREAMGLESRAYMELRFSEAKIIDHYKKTIRCFL